MICWTKKGRDRWIPSVSVISSMYCFRPVCLRTATGSPVFLPCALTLVAKPGFILSPSPARSASAYFHAPSSAIAALLHREDLEKRVCFPKVCKTTEKPVSVVWTGWNCAEFCKRLNKILYFWVHKSIFKVDPFYKQYNILFNARNVKKK